MNDGAEDKRPVEWIEIDRLKADLEHFTKSGIVEIAVRNPCVAEYMKHWEGRAAKAEAALGRHPMSTAPRDANILVLLGETIPDVPDWRVAGYVAGDHCAEMDHPEFAATGGWLIWNSDSDWFIVGSAEPTAWARLPQ